MPVRFRLDALLQSRTPPVTQSELARRSGVTLVTVNAIANNRTKQVSLRTLDRLSAALSTLWGRRVDVGELFDREEARRRR